MTNRLAGEKSPYLLQHAENPVNWLPWGDEAFDEARRRDVPVFLSIGYATCHWCHVMAHESFEDEEAARALNAGFVPVKVDREERPDIDQVYMTVCQVMTGGGGWPLSLFLTPDRKPFFAGTYFPKRARMGMPGFLDLLAEISRLWKEDRPRLLSAGERITAAIQPKSAVQGPLPDVSALGNGAAALGESFDAAWGGFGRAPKFPTPHHLTHLLRWHKRTGDTHALAMVEKTLDAMRAGGIFDQVGLGFHRYSVDERWLVPHFEKMLYDQAMLAMAYTEAYQATGAGRHARVAHEIFEYVLRDMTSPEGGFFSAEDADAGGVEGRFHTWTPAEVRAVLPEREAELFCRAYDIGPHGNFEEGRSIPHLPKPLDAVAGELGMDAAALFAILADARERLFIARERRVKPQKDDKILASWNGLMVAALAKGAQALSDPAYARAASRAASFVLNHMREPATGRLLHRFRGGEAAIPGFLDDYAGMVWGLIETYEAAFDPTHLSAAVELTDAVLSLFFEGGAFYGTARDAERLIVRDREIYDGATPSGNSVMALNLLRLSRLTGETRFEEAAEAVLRTFSEMVSGFPAAYTQYLCAVDYALGPVREIVISGAEGDPLSAALLSAAQRAFLPGRALHRRFPGPGGEGAARIAPYLSAVSPEPPRAYICENFACGEPVSSPEALAERLR